jgi:hypothetical protein
MEAASGLVALAYSSANARARRRFFAMVGVFA